VGHRKYAEFLTGPIMRVRLSRAEEWGMSPASGLRKASNFRGDGANGLALGGVLVPVLEDHPNRPLAGFLRIPRSACHDPILSRNGASGNLGAVQFLLGAFLTGCLGSVIGHLDGEIDFSRVFGIAILLIFITTLSNWIVFKIHNQP
jgi:hypothetical protein